jgi:hypothetical protein
VPLAFLAISKPPYVFFSFFVLIDALLRRRNYSTNLTNTPIKKAPLSGGYRWAILHSPICLSSISRLRTNGGIALWSGDAPQMSEKFSKILIQSLGLLNGADFFFNTLAILISARNHGYHSGTN